MRDQFRERLANLRPYNDSRVHVIDVKIEDNFDSKVPKSDRYSPKSILKYNSKSYTESPKSFDEIKPFSGNSSVDQSLKGTTPEYKSYDSYEKPNLSNDFGNKSLNKGGSDRILTTKQLNDKIHSGKRSNKLSSDGLECRHCRRSFASSERLVKHESVCLSNAEKSRQKFNSVEQRFKGQPKEYRNSYEKSLNVSLIWFSFYLKITQMFESFFKR